MTARALVLLVVLAYAAVGGWAGARWLPGSGIRAQLNQYPHGQYGRTHRKRDRYCFEINCHDCNTCDATGCTAVMCPTVCDTFCVRGKLKRAEP